VWGDRFASAMLDHYLAATGVSGQQAEEPVEPDRQDNLYHPVPEDRGAHGRFDDIARTRSTHLWVTKHRGPLIGAAAALAAGALAGLVQLL
jgi:hypothetical protein